MRAWLTLLPIFIGLCGAAPVSEQAYRVTHKDGGTEQLRVIYTPRLESASKELGRTPPGKILASGGQRCHWQAKVGVERQICQMSAAGEPACFTRFAKRLAAEELSLERVRVGGCTMNAARMDEDLARLRQRASDALPRIVQHDRQLVEQELQSLPNVIQVRAE